MIEATCAACGTVNRIAEADVPVGAKFVSCTSCKSKVQLAAKAPAIPALPKLSPPGKPRAIPAIPPKVPTPAKGVTTPAAKPLDLADLPAPKRQSPLAGTEPSSPKPAPRSALTGAELPVPKAAAKPPVQQSGALDLDDLMAPPGFSPGLADLPAPKSRSPLADLPAPKSAAKAALADLPAPKVKTPAKGVPTAPALADLPAPKRKTPAAGIPRTVGSGTSGKTARPAPALTDLPEPVGGALGSLELDDVDLPMPKPGVTDLLAPKSGGSDLPAPKGFFDDLPQPAMKASKAAGGIDLPAPKGFFDDLPQPASNAGKTQDLAPKGFFDDLPQPASNAGKTQDLAPKGFFDDLPQPASNAGKTQDLAPKAAGASAALPEVSAHGLFDDLPGPSQVGASLFDDLQEPAAKSPANAALGAGDIDLGPSLGGPGLELDTSGPELDLGLPLGQDEAFQDLDLSEPTRSTPLDDPSPIKIKTPAKGAERKPIPINVPPAKGADLKLDLADDPHAGKGAPAAVAGTRITPKKKAGAAEDSAEARAAKRRRTRLVLASLLGVVALGGGGFFFYQRHAAQQAKQAEVAAQVGKAEVALKAADPGHWDRARSAAEEALEVDATSARALGLAAEATIAGAIDNGRNYDARIAKGRVLIQDALGKGLLSPELERAQAVSAIAAKGQAQRAVDLLKAQIAKAPKDGWLQLYMGWAQLVKGDSAAAIKAFDQASALAPATKISALYGQGRAKLLLADVDGARTAFAAILETAKDHVCANIGLIATMPPSRSTQQVAELEAVLQRKDINSADPRCRVQAITLIGDVHRAAGRLDMARQRYRDALKLVPLDQPTHNGLAAIELRDDKLAVAADHIQKALAVNADHPDTLLLQAELFIREGKLPDAEKLIEKLAARQPPLPTLAQARLHVVKGKLLEAKGQPADAVEEYTKGAGLAGDLDLTPTMAAVQTLSALAKQEPDAAKAAELRARADQLLSALAARAQEDAQLSATLGIAYLQAGDPAKAEVFLRRSVAMKEDDPDSRLQLARACNAQSKTADALAQLEAALKLDGKRIDISLELARTYQSAGRHDEAIAAYDKLLAAENVPIVVRVNAGRYFAQRGLIDKAAAQAQPILDAEPENPGGLYLKAEGLIKAERPEEAAPLLVKASDLDPDAQYLDALGRALEGQLRKSKDTKYIEGARFAYERASKADPKLFHPWLGQGRMLVARRDWEPAIKPLEQASSIDKGHPEVRYYMGIAYHGLRSNPKYRAVAALWLESALKARPQLDLALRAEAAYMLGQLYADLNKLGNQASSLAMATRFGEEIEKQTGVAPPWLTESYYDLGDAYYKLNKPAAQKHAFQRFIDRKPQDSVRKNRANHDLATALQRY